METNIACLAVKIVDIGERGEIYLDIGGRPASLIEPKPALIYNGLVCINSNDSFWEHHISAKLNKRVINGCTDDSRIVFIAKRKFEGKLTKADIGTVFPPLEENPQE